MVIQSFADMKLKNLFLLFLLVGCAGTDLVDDTLTSLEISTPEEIQLVNGNFAQLVGQSTQLEIIATTDLGGSFPFSEVEWNSSNPSVAQITDGMVLAVSTGITAISATAMGVNSNTLNLTVTSDADGTSLIQILSPNNVTVLDIGQTLQLSAEALNLSGEPLEEEIEVTWSSDDPSIAEVDENGLVTGLANGMVMINAVAENASGSINLTVCSSESLSRSGNFMGINGYRASGMVALNTSSDGSITIDFASDFSVQNGPGLYLYLSNQSDEVTGGLEIGELRSTSGADSYEISESADINDFNYVILYCKPFGVGFGTAELSN